MTLTREQIIGAQDIKRELVNVPEWGGDVYVQSISGVQRDAFQSAIGDAVDAGQPSHARARLVVACVVDEHGKPLFTDADVPALSAKCADALDRIYAAAKSLSKLGAEAVTDAKKD